MVEKAFDKFLIKNNSQTEKLKIIYGFNSLSPYLRGLGVFYGSLKL